MAARGRLRPTAPGNPWEMAPLGARAAVAGRYSIGELLGRGGMGEVYMATDLRLDRSVALKKLRADLADDPAMRRRVEAEARLAARLVHPNVVTVFDSGVDDGHPFIVMERLDGRTLRDELEDRRLSGNEVRAVGLQILDALGAAHDIGLIHRDVKPGNVLVGSGGVWKVADFGIATSTDDDRTITRTGELLGSPSYLAPERLEGRPATATSDLYSLGVLLYEAATGSRPFGEGEPLTIAMRIRDGRHTPPLEAEPGLDPALADAIERAMSRDPAARFASAAEMAAALRPGGADPAEATVPTAADPDATAVIDRSPEPTAVLEPAGPRGATAAIAPPPSGDRATAGRHAPDRAPRRLLTLLIAGAIVLALLVVTVVALSAGDDAAPGRAGGASGSSAVPAPLQDAMDRLQEAIEP
jgi:eukaryotic-like serine/threonine-protein kinase